MNQSGEYLNDQHVDSTEILEKPIFSHSVKLEQTAKGVRVTVHVSASNFMDARIEAVDLFKKVQEDLLLEGLPLAPIEAKNGLGVKA
jgi:hypothetical protein